MSKMWIPTCIFGTSLLGVGAAAAQEYPTRPIRMIVPFAPGGPTDVVARVLAAKLSETFHQQVVVDNRAGAGGNIGTGLAANATPDGYTLLVVSSSFVVNPGLYAKIPYDPYKSFAPISNIAAAPNVFVVHPGIPAKSMAELAKVIETAPKKYSFATPGIGTTPDLSAALFRLTTRLDITNVPYNGAGPAIAATLANQVPLGCMAMPGVIPHIRGGRLRGLAVTSAKRSTQLPDVPTMAESGFKGHEADTLQAVLVPAGTSQAIVQRLHATVVNILGQPDVKDRITSLGFEIVASSPAEFAAQIRREVENGQKWSRMPASPSSKAPSHRRTQVQRLPPIAHCVLIQHFLNFLPLPQEHGSLRPLRLRPCAASERNPAMNAALLTPVRSACAKRLRYGAQCARKRLYPAHR